LAQPDKISARPILVQLISDLSGPGLQATQLMQTSSVYITGYPYSFFPSVVGGHPAHTIFQYRHTNSNINTTDPNCNPKTFVW